MKKLIITAMIIASAIIANAATVNWSVTSAYPGGSTDEMEGGYYAFFFVDSISATDAGQSAIYTQASALSQVAAGKIDFLSNAIGAAVEIDAGAMGSQYGSFVTDNTIGAYLVIIDAATAANATVAYVSDVLTTTINGMGASATLDWDDMTATQAASNWSTVGNVPEPTSGLLLILGMAGLALKRKHA